MNSVRGAEKQHGEVASRTLGVFTRGSHWVDEAPLRLSGTSVPLVMNGLAVVVIRRRAVPSTLATSTELLSTQPVPSVRIAL
jgi:hypothetical protein